MPDSHQVSFKDLIATVRKDPALMIVAGVLFVGLLYYLYTKAQQGNAMAAATTPSTDASTGFAPASGTYTYVEEINQPGGSPVPVPTPNPPGKKPPKPPVPPPPPPPGGSQKYPFPGKSPFPYQYGKPAFNWTDQNGKQWSVGFGPNGHVWGVPGFNITGSAWANTPIPPKTLIYQD